MSDSNRAPDAVVAVAIVVSVALGFISGCSLEGIRLTREHQGAAIERGYAVWAPAEDPRDKPIWQWVEPEDGDAGE